MNEEVNPYVNILLRKIEEELIKNEQQTIHWKTYKKELEDVDARLLSFRDQLTHPIMVPVGKKAFMKGTLDHTNEILVSLGDDWFVKKSAKESSELCQRRIKTCEEMLENLDKEYQLLDSRKTVPIENDLFGNEEVQEIVEPYDEEAEKEWRVRHRQKEKEYREKLAELRKLLESEAEKETFWNQINVSDLPEKKEDNITSIKTEDNQKLHSQNYEGDDHSEVEDDEDNEEESDSESEDDDSDSDGEETNSTLEETNLNLKKISNRVSFDMELDSDEEPIIINFKHSQFTPKLTEEFTPASIYMKFSECFKRTPKSILKTKSRSHSEEHDENEISFEENVEEKKALPQPISCILPDVVEHKEPIIQASTSRPISKFKAMRQAAKK
uniref:Unconventional prefoldin RPB5 interactor n=1 Tax=Clastoptera arizonana TaxID=38151 RepID=A0A1B6C309_9HEMI